ncbi:MAG TPA: uracil-DNA glycosylase family protein [Gemmatimonadaceae bacterium]|nr:uracil-DNA glycosylase family protein [Gemmatimonadaceae bacterium]
MYRIRRNRVRTATRALSLQYYALTMRATLKSRALVQHRLALGACQRCELGPGIRPVISQATNPRAMLVGQAPGKVEAEGGVPFSGRAGQTLFRWLARAGIDETTAREIIYISAVTRCYPGAHQSGRGDRVPNRQEQESCADWLETELRIVKPAVLIPVGRLAIERFLPDIPLSALIGTKRTVEHAGGRSLVIPLPHPSGASSWIHESDNKVLLEKAIELIGEFLLAQPVAKNRPRRASTPLKEA